MQSTTLSTLMVSVAFAGSVSAATSLIPGGDIRLAGGWDNSLPSSSNTGTVAVDGIFDGTTFGYGRLVVDMAGLRDLAETGHPVVFDATHSVQQPGGLGTASGGRREFIPVLARSAAAAGVAGFFMETHPDPSVALSDGPNAWPLHKMKQLLETLMSIDTCVKQSGYLEADYGLGVPE